MNIIEKLRILIIALLLFVNPGDLLCQPYENQLLMFSSGSQLSNSNTCENFGIIGLAIMGKSNSQSGIENRIGFSFNTGTTNGINETPGANNDNISIYPNPFDSKTTASFQNNEKQDYILRIFDLTGQMVFQRNHIQSSSIELLRGNLQSGIYIVELKGKKIFRGKMVLR